MKLFLAALMTFIVLANMTGIYLPPGFIPEEYYGSGKVPGENRDGPLKLQT